MTWLYRKPAVDACSATRSRMAAMTSPAWASDSDAHGARCSGESTSTSWIPLAGAWVNTGPRVVTAIGSSPAKAGYRFGTTRTSQLPFGP